MLNQEGSYIWNGLRGGEGNARGPLSFVVPFLFGASDETAALRSVVQLILNQEQAGDRACCPSYPASDWWRFRDGL